MAILIPEELQEFKNKCRQRGGEVVSTQATGAPTCHVNGRSIGYFELLGYQPRPPNWTLESDEISSPRIGPIRRGSKPSFTDVCVEMGGSIAESMPPQCGYGGEVYTQEEFARKFPNLDWQGKQAILEGKHQIFGPVYANGQQRDPFIEVEKKLGSLNIWGWLTIGGLTLSILWLLARR